MTINKNSYANLKGAKAAAKRQNIENPRFDETPDGRVTLTDNSRPLYNHEARVKSTIKGAVAIVWGLADTMHKQGAKRGEIVAAAIEQGVSPNTAKTQYQYWRKASGLVKARS